jgi:SSS family solute:Na+ symporter
MNLSLVDWLVVAVFFVVALGSVWWTKRYMRSVADFIAGNRCAGRYLLTITGLATGGVGAGSKIRTC